MEIAVALAVVVFFVWINARSERRTSQHLYDFFSPRQVVTSRRTTYRERFKVWLRSWRGDDAS